MFYVMPPSELFINHLYKEHRVLLKKLKNPPCFSDGKDNLRIDYALRHLSYCILAWKR